MSLDGYLRAAPKAELHVHLEGSTLPATFLELARRNRVTLPADTVEGLEQWFVFNGFAHFVEVYVAIARCMKTAEDFEEIAYQFGAAMARQRIRYAEVTFSPSMHNHHGVRHDVWFSGLTRGRQRAQQELGVEIHWIFDIVRDRHAEQDPADPEYTVHSAIDGMQDGVIALGLGGTENGNPPEAFAKWYDQARAAGLHSVPHAGELAGPVSVWGAIRALGAERLGHGVRSIEDPALVQYLAEHRIPIEACPTSNLRLGIYPNYAAHPLRRLFDAGVTVTINSDDPPLFNTTLNDEVALLPGTFGFDVAAIDEILLNGVRHCFQPLERRQAMEAQFRAELNALNQEHLAGGTDA